MPKKVVAFSVWSYPKVNLALDILGKSPSGYHKIQTVFHQVDVSRDEIFIEACAADEVFVRCDDSRVPTDKTNTVYKAVVLLRQYAGIREGVKIFIKKKIPVMGGLGGGSGNAAAVLKGLAKLWGVKCCSKAKNTHHSPPCLLFELASQIGMDCTFFFDGGTALGEHFGEKITPFPSPPTSLKFEIIETGVEISSRWAYDRIDIGRCGKNQNQTKKLLEALHAKDATGILKSLHNDFEESVFAAHPSLLKKKREVESSKPGCVLLCGSGGCLVRIYS